MAYVRSKQIKGHTYYYLVRGVREGHKVRQIFVRYLGKNPGGRGGGGGPAPAERASGQEFRPLADEHIKEQYTAAFMRLGCPKPTFNLRAAHKFGDVTTMRFNTTGKYKIVKVRFRRDVATETMAHEFGHVLDYLLRNENIQSGSLSNALDKDIPNLRALADYTTRTYGNCSREHYNQLRTEPVTLENFKQREKTKRYFDNYIYSRSEVFARLVSIALTDPNKAKEIAPASYAWLFESLNNNEEIRSALTESGFLS